MSFRIGSTVLLDPLSLNALQSYKFQQWRILGKISNVLAFLNDYEIDEIHLIIPSKGKSKKSINAISKISDMFISTPLCIGGGINSENISEITKDPFFERLVFNSALFDNHSLLNQLSKDMGRQAIVGYVPFVIKEGILQIYNSENNKFIEVPLDFWESVSFSCNELILLDSESEGTKQGFNFEVLNFLKFPFGRILISGGVTSADIKTAKRIGLAGVSIDNSVLHTEFSIKDLR